MKLLLALCLSSCIFAFSKPAFAETPLRVLILSGAGEYNSDGSFAAFKSFVEIKYNVACTVVSGKEASLNDLPALEQLEKTGVFIVFCRRFTLPKEQLELIKKYVLSGKPLIGIRTASHAFQDWLEMDKLVLGGNYKNHYGDEPAEVSIVEKAKDHPVLAGVKPPAATRKLYKNTGLSEDDTILLTAATKTYSEPVAWTRTVNGVRVFYTSLGTQEDFESDGFKQMLANAIFWTANRVPELKPAK